MASRRMARSLVDAMLTVGAVNKSEHLAAFGDLGRWQRAVLGRSMGQFPAVSQPFPVASRFGQQGTASLLGIDVPHWSARCSRG